MTTITIFDGNSTIEVEVEDSFALTYKAMAKRDELDERRETRRHQSLDKSLEHGFEVWDKHVDIEEDLIRLEENDQIHKALKNLTYKQRLVLIAYAVHKKSFREIGEELGFSKETVREHYLAAIKKMRKLLKD